MAAAEGSCRPRRARRRVRRARHPHGGRSRTLQWNRHKVRSSYGKDKKTATEMQVPEHRRTVAKKTGTGPFIRSGKKHRPSRRADGSAARRKAGRTPQSRMHTAKPDAHRKAGCTPQSRMHTAKPNADGKTKAERPLWTLCLSSGCASPYLTSIWRVAAAVSSIFFLGMSMVITPFSTLAEIFSRSILSGSSRLCWNCV